MAFFSEIFFSTLIGKPVYTVDEKYYGMFRDFVVRRQSGNFIITKVRIRTRTGARVVIPWSEVHSIEADPVSLKLKRKLKDISTIDYEDDELRLKRDFLDQQIIDTNANRVVRVNDLKIVAVQNELFLVAADIGIRGLLRRLNLEWVALWLAQIFRQTLANTLIPSAYIDPFPARIRHDITLTVAQDSLKKMHPADLADIMENLDSFERMSILQSLPVEQMANTIAELEPDVRKKLLSKLKDETVTKVLERLAPDAATDIATQLPKHRMQHVLARMKATDADEIRQLMKFKEDTAGALMTTEFVALAGTLSAHDALEHLRTKGGNAEQIYYLYILGPNEELTGVISLRDIVFVDPSVPLSSLIRHKPVYVRLRSHVDEVIEKCTKYNLIAIPVVGKKKRLEGVITVDDILSLQ